MSLISNLAGTGKKFSNFNWKLFILLILDGGFNSAVIYWSDLATKTVALSLWVAGTVV